jgi:hypothetical protein
MSLHSSSERFSRAEVSQAVSRQLHLPPELDAVANLSGKLHYFVNQMRSFRTASLDGADFKSLIMNNITPELMQMLDPAKQNAAKREQAERANVFSAEAAAWAGKGQWINGQWVSGSSSSRGDSGSSNGARFDKIDADMANGNWASSAGQAYMRAYAVQQGLSWAANHPELLRLGPSAIKALADVHLKHENYERLTGKFGLTPRETVKTAKEAKKRGVDLNNATEQADRIHQKLHPTQQHEFNRHIKEFFPNMSKPEAQRKFNGHLDKLEHQKPELAPDIKDLRKTLKLRAELEHKAEQRADMTEREAATKTATRDSRVDALDAAEPDTKNVPTPDSGRASKGPPTNAEKTEKPPAKLTGDQPTHPARNASNEEPKKPATPRVAAKTAAPKVA